MTGDVAQVAVPENAATLRIAAVYEDDSGDQASAELNAVAYYSPQEMYVQVHSSTDEGRIGESAVLHLKSNFGFESYQYVVSARKDAEAGDSQWLGRDPNAQGSRPSIAMLRRLPLPNNGQDNRDSRWVGRDPNAQGSRPNRQIFPRSPSPPPPKKKWRLKQRFPMDANIAAVAKRMATQTEIGN